MTEKPTGKPVVINPSGEQKLPLSAVVKSAPQKPKNGFKDLVGELDLKSVALYVLKDIIIPSGKKMLVDSVSKGAARAVYGDGHHQYREGNTQVTYVRPINRFVRPERPIVSSSYRAESRQAINDLIFKDRTDADNVLEMLVEILSRYGVVTMADFNQLANLSVSPMDTRWGWTMLGSARVVSVDNGYVIQLPTPQEV